VAALFGEEYAVRVGGGEAVGFGFKKGAQMTQAPTPAGTPLQADFSEITRLIVVARARAVQAVNTTLIDLYWQVGQTISQKIAQAQWGDGVVAQLAAHLAQTQPGLTGFTSRNLFRMRQFYEAYRDDEKVSPLLRQLPWTHNLIILNQSKRPEEREFYLRLAIRENWSKRELERQFKTALFERAVLHPAKVSPLVSQMQPDALSIFKDSYLVEFLGLPQGHAEAARASRHWRAVVCQQRRQGGGIRAKPQPVASADCAVPNPVTRQSAATSQVARVLFAVCAQR
jgi:predicted nuclease of restriction endonuclease-like (RecB) superfamily